MTTAPAFFSEDELRSLIERPKLLVGELAWDEDPNQTRYILARFVVADDSGATIPGLSVEFDFRQGMVATDCKFTFTLFSQRGNRRCRVYQIEVIPIERRGHNGDSGGLYGPHQHFGEAAQSIDTDGLGCLDHERWLHEFLRRANIGWGGTYLPPQLQGDLF